MRTRMLMVVLVVMATSLTAQGQEPKAEPAELTAEERKELEVKAEARNAEMFQLYGQGKAIDALKAAAEVLAIQKKLHADENHLDLAASLIHVPAEVVAIPS